MISADPKQIARFTKSLFCYADPGTYVSLRAFCEKEGGVFDIQPVEIGSTLENVINEAFGMAQRGAEAEITTVFCPPIATFKTTDKATEAKATVLPRIETPTSSL